jgi:hypothetical protein
MRGFGEAYYRDRTGLFEGLEGPIKGFGEAYYRDWTGLL